MTQDGLMPSQLQGAGALPRNRVECAFFQWRPQLPDPDDEMVLELAANSRADTIVTVNTRDFLPAARTFGVEVLRPGEFLRRLRS